MLEADYLQTVLEQKSSMDLNGRQSRKIKPAVRSSQNCGFV